MKRFHFIFSLLFCIQTVSAQTEGDTIQRTLTALTDQFDKPFQSRQDGIVWGMACETYFRLMSLTPQFETAIIQG